jgi:death-on-curing protein
LDEPVWIDEPAVYAIQLRQLAEHGGLVGVRDPGGVEAAMARPRQLFAYAEPPPDLATLAAAYAVAFTRNHPFVDGNKRVSLVVARTFLRLNGRDLVAIAQEKYVMTLGLASGELPEEEFAAWVRANLASWEPRR